MAAILPYGRALLCALFLTTLAACGPGPDDPDAGPCENALCVADGGDAGTDGGTSFTHVLEMTLPFDGKVLVAKDGSMEQATEFPCLAGVTESVTLRPAMGTLQSGGGTVNYYVQARASGWVCVLWIHSQAVRANGRLQVDFRGPAKCAWDIHGRFRDSLDGQLYDVATSQGEDGMHIGIPGGSFGFRSTGGVGDLRDEHGTGSYYTVSADRNEIRQEYWQNGILHTDVPVQILTREEPTAP